METELESASPLPVADAAGVGIRLADWTAMARGAFAGNTIRAWKADWEIFGEFCRTFRVVPLPAVPETVRDFVFECLAKEKKPATIRRYVSTIGRAHRAAGVADPTITEAVKMALKEMSRSVSARQRQARGLVWKEIEIFLGSSREVCGTSRIGRWSRWRTTRCAGARSW